MYDDDGRLRNAGRWRLSWRDLASALRRQLATHGMSGVIEAWFNQLAPQMNARERGRVARLVLEAEQLDDRGERDWAFAARVLETVGLGESGGGSVHVLTIHKAKGLEFDHVILRLVRSALGFRWGIL